MKESVDFDSHAENYDGVLNQALSASGEERAFFARERIAWLARCLKPLDLAPTKVLDYGCGTGGSMAFFFEFLKPRWIIGVDVSTKCLQVARYRNRSLPVQFLSPDEYNPNCGIDLVFCNGVFHHIPPCERQGVAQYIMNSLRPGGVLAMWENNPWNPGTRYIMSKIPFDRDAIPVSAPEVKALMRLEGFQVFRTDYYFIFPRFLRAFRGLEGRLTSLPLGAQYQVLCLKDQDS